MLGVAVSSLTQTIDKDAIGRQSRQLAGEVYRLRATGGSDIEIDFGDRASGHIGLSDGIAQRSPTSINGCAGNNIRRQQEAIFERFQS
jgi:hypothetical protein